MEVVGTTSLAPLLSQHIKTILESGLLLDEDYEVLLNASNFRIYLAKTATATLPAGFIATSLSTLVSVIIAKRYNQPWVILPPLAAALVVFTLKRRALLRERRRQEVARGLIKCFTRLRKVNTSILRYLKMRGNSSKQELMFNNVNVKEFLAFWVCKNINHFKRFSEEISFLVGLADDCLNDDYLMVKEVNFELILTSNDDDNNAAKIQDLNTFLVSKYLNYLGLVLSNRNLEISTLEFLLDKKLPTIITTVNELSALVQQEFNNLRYSASEKVQIDAKTKAFNHQKLSGKLQQTLVGAVNNLSIIMEKSRSILCKVEVAMEDDNNVLELERALSDLRDHAHATYESLDVLCRLYGILSDPKNSTKENQFKIASANLDDNQPNLSYADNSEALEENYELYIPEADEEVVCEQPKEVQHKDQTGVYLNLMLKELRQSLRQHERFIAARNKRGINDDDDNDDIPEQTISIPKFNLQQVNNKVPVPAPRASKLPTPMATTPPLLPPLPPPPPPPLPRRRLNLEQFEDAEPKSTLFESVKALSNQLKIKEDVFGDDSD